MFRPCVSILLLLSTVCTLCHGQPLPAPLDEGHIAKLFDAAEFTELEKIAGHARITKERNRAGDWQLATFYEATFGAAGALARNSESKFYKHMDAWKEQFPNSVTWRIIKADAVAQLGWDARGGGWATEVTLEGWAGLEKYLTEAWTILQEARKISTEDPALYSVFTSVALGLHDDPTKDSTLSFGSLIRQTITPEIGGRPAEPKRLGDEIFEEAIQRETLYTPLYYELAPHLFGRWGGQPGELERFADRAAALTAVECGESMYARVAWGTVTWIGDDSFRLETNFDWSRIKAGYERLLQDYPDSNFLKNQFCKMACLYKDRDTAAAMLAKMDRPLPNKCWMALGYFEHWSGWINGKAQYPEVSPMVLAVKSTDLGSIERLAKDGESLEVFMLGGYTPLSLAVGRQDLEMTELLLQLGADMNAMSYRGNTPVTEASRWSDTAILKALLDKGANPNQKNIEGWTGLHQAAVDGNIPTARMLLAAKADINARANNQWTPLQAAADRNQPHFVRYLLEQGADKTIKNPDGHTALDIATLRKFPDIVKILE